MLDSGAFSEITESAFFCPAYLSAIKLLKSSSFIVSGPKRFTSNTDYSGKRWNYVFGKTSQSRYACWAVEQDVFDASVL